MNNGLASIRVKSSATTTINSGVDFPSWTTNGFSSAFAFASLKRLAAEHVRWVTFVPTWYQAHGDSNAIHPQAGKSAADGSLIAAMVYARHLGLRVALKPHVDVIDGSWRGYIAPESKSAWFSSYTGFIEHYASLARAHGATILVIGCELKNMTGADHTGNWEKVIKSVRYTTGRSIKLTYASNWDETQQIGFWPELDYIGVDAYFPLQPATAPTVSQLTTAWAEPLTALHSLSQSTGRPVLFTELGYTPTASNYQNPSQLQTGSDYAAQKIAYQAANCAVAENNSWLKGVWYWEDPADKGAVSTDPFALRPGLPVDQVLTTC
jgi:hypothetical protein